MLQIALLFLVVVALGLVAFLRFSPVFGAKASDQDRQAYSARSSLYDGKIFSNEREVSVMQEGAPREGETVLAQKEATPKGEIPMESPAPIPAQDLAQEQLTVTWLGHSSLLVQMHGMNVLIDPVFSQRTSPVRFAGPKRFSAPPIDAEHMPEIDLLLLSHDHYDHMDMETILALDDKVGQYVVPLGLENHLARWGIDGDRVQTMAWWEQLEIDGLTIGCTPAQHFSGRGLNDRFETLWASWVLKDEHHQIFESGDTGYGPHFQEIYEVYGAFDLVMLDCAQYSVRWAAVHMFPEQSYTAAQELHASYVMPIHWATVSMSDHPWDDPAQRMEAAAQGGDITLVTPRMGQTMTADAFDKFQERWWKDIP